MQEALGYNVGVARNVSRLLYGGGSHGHPIYTLTLTRCFLPHLNRGAARLLKKSSKFAKIFLGAYSIAHARQIFWVGGGKRYPTPIQPNPTLE